jgi:hypothetical protein
LVALSWILTPGRYNNVEINSLRTISEYASKTITGI